MASRQVLDSWKEISAYLSRSVMTCQRWERQLDLPIHRLDGTPRARVFAYPDELDSWLTEKLHSREAKAELERTRSRRARRAAAMAAVGLLVLATVGGLAWRLYFHPLVATPARAPSLAVLPFKNNTGDKVWNAWKLALPDLLTIDLRQSKFLDVVKTSNFFQAVGPLAEADAFSSEDLKTMAGKAGVDYVLSGSLQKAGDKAVLVGLVHDARTGQMTGSPRAVCRAENNVFSSVDELSRNVRKILNLSARQIRGDIDRRVARISTDSPEAFRLYSQAYRIQGQLKFDQAISPLQKAVELDPRFGLAYRALFHACRAMSRTEETRRYGEMAVRWAGRIEERERYLFLADYFEFEELDKAKAREAYRKLDAHYPYDLTNLGLAEHSMGREEWGQAVPVLERLLLRYPGRSSVVRTLLTCYRSVGRYADAVKLLDDLTGAVAEPGTDANSLLGIRRSLALSQGQFDIAHDCAERMKAANPNILSYLSNEGFVYFLQDDLSNAEAMYRQMAESDNIRFQRDGYNYLAAVSLSRGRIEEAKQRIRRAIELCHSLEAYGPDMERPYRHFLAYLERLSGRLPEALKEAELACGDGEIKSLGPFTLQQLHLRALITLEMNRSEDFEKQVEAIKGYLIPDRSPWGAPRFMRVYYHLLGHRELRKGQYDLAIRYFWKAADLISTLAARSMDADHAKYFYDLAEAYRRSGDLPAAVVMYEKVILPTVSREFSGDLYARSHYWMGLDSELRVRGTEAPALAQERRLKAIGHYRKFLELWKDADPIFPEVEDARKRLAALEAH